MIKITGASGGFGKSAIEFLETKLSKGEFGAIGRNPEKLKEFSERGIQTFVADYNDYNSLLDAFQGADTLLFVSGNEVGHRAPQHENVVKAAIAAGVKHIVYTGLKRKDETAANPLGIVSTDHFATEKMIKESGMKYTILKNTLYSDIYPMFLGNVADSSTVFLPVGDAKITFATRSDMAEAAANILCHPELHENKEYDFANSESVTFGEIAEYLTDVLGKEINFVSPSVDEYQAALKSAGVDDGTIGFSLLFINAIRAAEFAEPSLDIEKLIGRKPESSKEYLTKFFTK